MIVLDAPIVVQAAPIEDQSDVIEVIGTQADQTLKIDRRTYRVQQTPHSAQKNAVQLLRGLPAVIITPEDQILLLGASNAKIFVNGRPYPGDAKQYLRGLHGSEIDRIEVITNPSAQFSAEGTAGIINFILRKTQEGTSGNVSLEASSYGRLDFDSTLKFKRDKWAYEIQAGGNVGAMVRSSYHRRRSVEAILGGQATINDEDGESVYNGTVGRLSGKITYDLDRRTSISAKVGGGGGHDIFVNNAEFRGITSDFTPYSERRRLSSMAGYLVGELDIAHKGNKDGETLTISANIYGNPEIRDLTDARSTDGSSYSIAQRKETFVGRTQIDWNRPLRKGQILSLGGSWNLNQSSEDYRFSGITSDGSPLPNAADQYDASSTTISGYVSFQQSIGKLTVTPGARVENNSRHIVSPGFPDTSVSRTNFFPTFHLRYPLGNKLELTASYSKRIDRVPLQNLRPYRSLEDSITMFRGNPGLLDQSTDAYEINLLYRSGKIELGAILYTRETSNVWSKVYSTTPEGGSIYSFINAGRSQERGAQFDLSTPILPRVKANASVNIFDQSGPVDSAIGSQRQSVFRYTANGSVQWSAPDRGEVPGDVIQAQWAYNSPSRQFQVRELSWNEASLSYTHSFSRSLSLSANFQYRAASRHRLAAPLVQEFYSQKRGPEFKVKILKTIGN